VVIPVTIGFSDVYIIVDRLAQLPHEFKQMMFHTAGRRKAPIQKLCTCNFESKHFLKVKNAFTE